MGDSSIGGEKVVWSYIQWNFFTIIQVKGLKGENDWKNNYGKNRGGLEISII